MGETDPIPVLQSPDAGIPDAGKRDAGSRDAGTSDAGTPDGGTPDAGYPSITVKIDEDDLSVGSARYSASKQISKNLSMKSNGKNRPKSPMAHSNIEVHLYDDNGKEVPMTRRLVRHWYVKPKPGAVVSDLNQWEIVGLKSSDAGTPLPVAPGQPAAWNFQWDRPSSKDAPGLQGISIHDKSFGQLQEFLVGNAKVGGAYYQVYVIEDESGVRVMTSTPVAFPAKEYRKILNSIDSGEYTKKMGRQLFRAPTGATDNSTPYPGQPQPLQIPPLR
jgi:hypothetical protein